MLTGKSTKSKKNSLTAGSGKELTRSRFSLEKGYVAYIMIAPFVIVFLIFSLYTVLYTFSLSFSDMKLTEMSKAKFNGGDNFVDFFEKIYNKMWKDRSFSISRLFEYSDYHQNLKAIANTWKIWLVNFIPQLAIAMLLSVWFNSTFLKLKFVGFWRSILYMPNLLMPATVGVIFFKIFQNDYAPANQFLVGVLKIVDQPVEFLMKPPFSQYLVAFIQWWMWYGNTIVILVAGMSSISVSLYESAMIDGAGGWKMFRYITLPSLRPILVFTLVTSLVGGMQMFDIPYLISAEGSPENTITTIYMLMHRTYLAGKAVGYSAMIGVIILMMTTVCSLLIFRVLRDKDAAAERKASVIARREKRRHLQASRGGR